jgi:uncharacterized protein YbjT (DUF2867 family)
MGCVSKRPPVLVTGATGHVGWRLVHALLERSEHVHCLARRREATPPQAGVDAVAPLPPHRLVFAGVLDGVAREVHPPAAVDRAGLLAEVAR